MIWRVSVLIWMLAPILGWLPNTAPRLATNWWWVLASFVLIPIALRQKSLRDIPLLPILLALACLSYLFYVTSAFATTWIGQVFIIGTAACLIYERVEWGIARDSVIIAALIQIPFVLWQIAGNDVIWLRAGGDNWPVSGTVSRRAVLSALFGCASIISTRWKAWSWLGLACLSGSWTGVIPAFLRLFWKHRGFGIVGLSLFFSGLFFSMALWVRRLSLRFQIWHGLDWWQGITGEGFGAVKAGFTYDLPVGYFLGWRDYHNTWLDLIARTGVLGILAFIIVLAWAIKMWPIMTDTTKWLTVLLSWISVFQSMESYPVWVLLMFVWLFSNGEKRDVKTFRY